MIEILSEVQTRIFTARDNLNEVHIAANFDMVDVAMANCCYY